MEKLFEALGRKSREKMQDSRAGRDLLWWLVRRLGEWREVTERVLRGAGGGERANFEFASKWRKQSKNLFPSNQVRGLDRQEIQWEGMSSPAPVRTGESPSVLSPRTQSTSNGNAERLHRGKYRQSGITSAWPWRRLTWNCSHLLRAAGSELDCFPLPVLPLPFL